MKIPVIPVNFMFFVMAFVFSLIHFFILSPLFGVKHTFWSFPVHVAFSFAALKTGEAYRAYKRGKSH